MAALAEIGDTIAAAYLIGWPIRNNAMPMQFTKNKGSKRGKRTDYNLLHVVYTLGINYFMNNYEAAGAFNRHREREKVCLPINDFNGFSGIIRKALKYQRQIEKKKTMSFGKRVLPFLPILLEEKYREKFLHKISLTYQI